MNDDDLRRRFQSLREAETAEAPPYRRPESGRPVPTHEQRGSRWPSLGLQAAAAAIALWLLIGPVRVALGPPEDPVWTPGPWAMPTDALLELPGRDLLTLPAAHDPLLHLELDLRGPAALNASNRRIPA